MVTKNESFIVLCALILATFLARGAQADPLVVPPPIEILAKLGQEHPRLLVSADDFVRLKERAGTDPRLREWRQKPLREGETPPKDTRKIVALKSGENESSNYQPPSSREAPTSMHENAWKRPALFPSSGFFGGM